MRISEEDVSILIPCYRRPAMARQAIESAIASGAGEIIVSDNASNDGTVESLSDLRDPRIRWIIQPVNVGLWPNHLALLQQATLPWIKFIQDDDYLVPGGLKYMVSFIGPETTVVGARNIFEDKTTGEHYKVHDLPKPKRYSSNDYMKRFASFGNEPGTPSMTLWRADVLQKTVEAWRNDQNSDLIANVLAAAGGEVVLLPPGPVVTGVHQQRGGSVQGMDLRFRRIHNTVRFLSGCTDPRIRRFARIYGFCSEFTCLGTLLNQLRRRQDLPQGYGKQVLSGLAEIASIRLLRDFPAIFRYLHERYRRKSKVTLDHFPELVSSEQRP